MSMTEYLQVWRARVADGSVERLLELRPAAIAEAQGLCPELRAADLPPCWRTRGRSRHRAADPPEGTRTSHAA